MRRNAALLFLLVFLVPLVSGCHLFKKKPTVQADPLFNPADTYIPPSTGSDLTADAFSAPSYPVREEVEPVTRSLPPVARQAAPVETVTMPSTSRMHTVARKETLYSLARLYYGDHRRWRDIYNANRESISDPNKIRVGQQLAIP